MALGVAAFLALCALLAVGVGAYVLGSSTTAVVPAATAAPGSVSAPTTMAAPATAPTVAGPALVDTDGSDVDAAVALQVDRVYQALRSGDLSALRAAYSADGSDDGLTTGPHLRDAAVRGHLLEALRVRPVHRDGTYTYRHSGYSLLFNQAEVGALPAGLGRITGPWSTSSAEQTASKTSATSSSTPTPARSSTAGTHSTKTAKHSGATRAPGYGYGPGRPIIEADRSDAPDCQGIALNNLPGACVCGGGAGGMYDLCP